MPEPCVCQDYPTVDLKEIAPGVYVCGWCKRCYDVDGNRVDRPPVIDVEPIDLTHLDDLSIARTGI